MSKNGVAAVVGKDGTVPIQLINELGLEMAQISQIFADMRPVERRRTWNPRRPWL
jgi:hypothetical protein